MTSVHPGVAITDLSEPERRLYNLASQPMPPAEVAVRLGVSIGEADRRIAALLLRLALPDWATLQKGSRTPLDTHSFTVSRARNSNR